MGKNFSLLQKLWNKKINGKPNDIRENVSKKLKKEIWLQGRTIFFNNFQTMINTYFDNFTPQSSNKLISWWSSVNWVCILVSSPMVLLKISRDLGKLCCDKRF